MDTGGIPFIKLWGNNGQPHWSPDGRRLAFSARVGEEGKLFGSVTPSDIVDQLKAQGIDIEKRMIDLHEPIRALGVYKVAIKLHADVKPEIKVWVIKA